MILRRFTAIGVEQFRQFLAYLRANASTEVPMELLNDPASTEELPVSIEVEYKPFDTRLELARYLDQTLTGKGLPGLETDIGLWSWLSLFFFAQLCPLGKTVGMDHRHIPEPDDWRVNYRHLLRNPYLIYRMYADEPECLACILANPPHIAGDIYENYASRQEFIANRNLQRTLTKLYVDTDGQSMKRSGPASALRLVDVLHQFDLTFDLYAVHPGAFFNILPKEFNKFKPAND